jgi:thiamine biosynthesis lipoprotein
VTVRSPSTTDAAPAAVSFPALGTTAVLLVTEPAALPVARAALERTLADVDQACSRFRPDSDLVRVNAAPSRAVRVGPTLVEALWAALGAARATNGLVDPTVGRAVRLLGYDRTFADVPGTGPALHVPVERVPGWKAVRVDQAASTVLVPPGVELDLGATAKAWCADRAATAAVEAATAAGRRGAGVLVSLGGDVATAGPAPEGGWVIRLADRHDDPLDGPGPVVAITGGGLATSGTAARRWYRGGALVHHIVDPATGQPAAACWGTVSVTAASCLDANVAATAAVILGPAAPAWLTERGGAARLVAEDSVGGGRRAVVTVGGWPADEVGAATADSEAER